MTYIIIWIACGILSLCIGYQTYKNTTLYINELWGIGIVIFLLGPISLTVQILVLGVQVIKYFLK